jgi:hypothetical protein
MPFPDRIRTGRSADSFRARSACPRLRTAVSVSAYESFHQPPKESRWARNGRVGAWPAQCSSRSVMRPG